MRGMRMRTWKWMEKRKWNVFHIQFSGEKESQKQRFISFPNFLLIFSGFFSRFFYFVFYWIFSLKEDKNHWKKFPEKKAAEIEFLDSNKTCIFFSIQNLGTRFAFGPTTIKIQTNVRLNIYLLNPNISAPLACPPPVPATTFLYILFIKYCFINIMIRFLFDSYTLFAKRFFRDEYVQEIFKK